jgi:GDP-4-dehydro-6-deoxy-D-mannose reductase
MKIMITGAAGFIGSYLQKHCVKLGCSVLGIGITQPEDNWGDARFEHCDVRDEKAFLRLLKEFQPERIFHLAAQSYPTVSLSHPRETIDTNVVGTVNLFECIRESGLNPFVVVACSSAEYGPVASEDLPVKETHTLMPLHPYGVSKVAQDLLAAQYFINYAIPAIRIRIFNTTGPGKINDVCSDLTRRAAEIELGMHKQTMIVGNLTSRRAIIDVRDQVRALWLSAEHCKPGEVYNVGATEIYSVQQIVEIIRSKSSIHFELQQHPALVRAADELVIAGDISKFHACSSWTPEIRLSTTLSDMLAWWRYRLSSLNQDRPLQEASQGND